MYKFLKLFSAVALAQAIFLVFANSTGVGERIAYLFYVLPTVVLWWAVSGQKINVSPLQVYLLPIILYSVLLGLLIYLTMKFRPSPSDGPRR